MTKTYDDIEAVIRLLEEKEKDLELTARIGKELLQANNKLENTVSSLETDLKAAHEKLTQLHHEVLKKTELIQILTNDMDDSLFDSTSSGRINLETLQRKMASIQDENKALRNEYSRLAQEADTVEAQERMLLKDITGQLSCANSSMNFLEDELDRQKDENRCQHEQILALQAKLDDTEVKLRKLMNDNDELSSLLAITKENQGCLAVELSEFKARYYEMEGLLQDAREQLRTLKKKQLPGARLSMFSSLGQTGLAPASVPFDSLQSELEMSMHSELSSTDSGIADMPQYKKVFETVRCASRNSLSSSESVAHLGGMVSSMVSSGGPRMSFCTQEKTQQRRSSGSIYSSSSLGYPSLDSTGHSDSESSLQTDSDSDGYPGGHQKGIPGVPGAADLEAALRRLTPGDVLARRANLQHGPQFGGYESAESYLPFGCRTPDSLMSTGSGNYLGWKLPEKLQIVKPIEGSQTLHQWSQLAKPTFGGLLEERPGVKIRGGKELEEMGLESYGLCDLEEDDEYSTNPGKIFDSSAPTYTLTNSMVMHPDDGTFLTPSNRGSRIASVCSSLQPSPPQTPRPLSRRNSCSTFSTTFGLAKVLNERGIKAVTPSAVATPCDPACFSPTATPCNSPDVTPPLTRCGSPEPYEEFSIQQLILSSVPQFLLDTVGGGAKKKVPPSRGKHRKRDESLVSRVERAGITSLMGTPAALSISAGMYSRGGALASPMTQLTCLLPSTSTENLKQKAPEEAATSIKKTPSSAPATGRPSSGALGVPGRPGTGVLNRRLEQLNSRKQRRQGNGATRPDLGTVGVIKPPPEVAPEPQQQATTLGTLSSLLFGRKGGLF